MPIPDFQSFMLPTLQVAADGKPHSMSDFRGKVKLAMNLSVEDLQEMLPSGKKSKYDDRVAWSVTYLYQARLLERQQRGVYGITDRGRELLSKAPQKITSDLLSQFKEFEEFHSPKSREDQDSAVEPIADSEVPAQTPEERLESGYEELKKSLAKELMGSILDCTPAFFEKLVVSLLVAMGYGGSIQDAGRAVGKSGDGGIDGIIKEDKLGLDNVYIQAKRWKDGNSVGVKEVREFVGSLSAKRASKGVLITTSSFTKDAQDEVRNHGVKIVLIDGGQLTDLMIEHDVGVTLEKTYSVKKIDHDFFEDD